MKREESFLMAQKEKLILLAAGLILAAAAGLKGSPPPEVPGGGQLVKGGVASAEVGEIRSFVEDDFGYYFDARRKDWVFVQKAVSVQRTAIELPLPTPIAPRVPWPLPQPGPLLRFSGNQPRAGDDVNAPAIPEGELEAEEEVGN